MYSNSNEYKNANLQPYRQFESRITIGNRIITNEEVVSINLQQSIQQEATFTIGNTISSSLNLTFLHNDIETSDREIINLEIGLLANTDYEYIPLGIYNIDLCNSNDTTTNITAYDNMVKFDISYEENNSQPTVHSIINRLSELTGVEFAGTLSNYTNYSLLSLSSYTCREVLGFVAGVLGCNAIIDRQGKFKFIGISNAPSLTITSENYFNYAKQSKLYKISKIVNEVEGKIQEKGSLTDDTVCLYVYNPLVNETILQSLYNKFYDFSFLPFELSWSGDLSLDLGDSIQIVDKKGNSLIQPILSQIFTYTGGLSSVIQSQGDTKLANTYTTSTSEEKEAERIIKRVADIEDTDTVTNIVHKYYLSTSKTELLDGTWVTKLPSSQEQQDKFLWYKTVTTYKDGITAETDPVCITGQDGAQGPQGVPGKDGQDGKDGVTYYTWIRYADTSSGGGISNDPTGKKYIGFAYNKTSPTETNNPTDYSWSLIQGEKGDQGVPGGTGADGKTFYTWIKYSDNADGTGLYDTPTATTKYIGIATNKTSQSESSNKTDYVWSQFKGEKGDRGPQGLQGVQGEKGEQGVPGTNGTNGKTSYFHIKYSSVANPTTASQMTETPNTYIGTYVDFIEADSSDPTKYTWARFEGLQGEKGEQGIPGTNGLDGMTSYLHLKYSNDGGKTFTSNNGETPGDYIGQYTDFTQADSTSTSSYAWSKIKGEKGEPGTDGAQGIPGPAGANGQTLYTWVKYSNNADGSNMTDDPNSKYIGIAVNKTTQTESTNKTDYSWSLIKGADGATGSQGVPGPPGEDGQTLYTWIKYANNSNGSGMSNSPEGKTYIGFAYNKTTPTESNNASDYSWSLIKGADGSDAKYITVSGEQVFKYTNNFSDTPTPSSIALRADKHNITDSCKRQ